MLTPLPASAGAVAGLLTLQQKTVNDDECFDATQRCTAEGRDAADTGRMLGAISTTGFVVGAVGLGAAAYLLLTEPKDPTSARLRASIGANSAALSLERRF